jgi:hypothetical protein
MRLARHFEECIEGISTVIRDGIRAGEFRETSEPRAVAFLPFGSMQGLLLLSKSLKRVDPLEQGFSMALNLLRNTR